MVRIVTIGAVVAGLLVPAQALSEEGASTAGRAKGNDPSISFNFKTNRRGQPTRVFNFGWENVPATCDQGPINTDGSDFNGGRLNDRNRFRHTTRNADNGGGSVGKVVIRGKYLGRGKWSGSLRATGDYAGGEVTNCDTGKFKWEARSS